MNELHLAHRHKALVCQGMQKNLDENGHNNDHESVVWNDIVDQKIICSKAIPSHLVRTKPSRIASSPYPAYSSDVRSEYFFGPKRFCTYQLLFPGLDPEIRPVHHEDVRQTSCDFCTSDLGAHLAV